MSNQTRVKPIPDGYHSATPYLIVRGATKALEFYKKAFGAEEVLKMEAPGGKIMHAEIRIGDSIIMLADEHPEHGFKSPEAFGGSSVSIVLYVEDVDSFADRGVNAGLTVKRNVEDMFYGDRTGTFQDPFGHVWSIATHKEDVSPEELRKRAAQLFGK